MMAKKLPWFPFYAIDWLTSPSVCGMTGNEIKGYINLLCHESLEEDGGLPDDDVSLATMAKLQSVEWVDEETGKPYSEWEFCKDQILKHFERRGGRIYNLKLESILSEQKAKRLAQERGAETTNANRIGNRNGNHTAKRNSRRIAKRSVRASDSDSNSQSISVSQQSSSTEESSQNKSLKIDDENPPKIYTNERDELVALLEEDTGVLPDAKLIHGIKDSVEINGGTLRAYLDDIGPRLKRLRPKEGGHAGFFLHHAQHWGTINQQPVAVSTNGARGKCPKCTAGRLGESEYCDCPMGRDLRVIESREKESV